MYLQRGEGRDTVQVDQTAARHPQHLQVGQGGPQVPEHTHTKTQGVSERGTTTITKHRAQHLTQLEPSPSTTSGLISPHGLASPLVQDLSIPDLQSSTLQPSFRSYLLSDPSPPQRSQSSSGSPHSPGQEMLSGAVHVRPGLGWCSRGGSGSSMSPILLLSDPWLPPGTHRAPLFPSAALFHLCCSQKPPQARITPQKKLHIVSAANHLRGSLCACKVQDVLPFFFFIVLCQYSMCQNAAIFLSSLSL